MSKAKVLNNKEIKEMCEKIEDFSVEPNNVDQMFLIENFMSDTPGYIGDILYVQFTGDADLYGVFVQGPNDNFVHVLPANLMEV